LNRIRIAEVKVDRDQISVRGDATAAYLPDLGLQKFVREFVYRPDSGFTISDEVEATKPSSFTLLMHADDRIEKENDDRFSIKAGGVKLLIQAMIEGPKGSRPSQFRSVIEPNTVTAPGPPGAVDKGERQERGQKLVLSTPAPVIKASFRQRLTLDH
jgi:hypothetical protein